MANNFSTVKINQASKKFLFVRISPHRYLNDDLSGPAAGIYTVTQSNYVISNVYENGAALSEVSGTPAVGEWSIDETTWELSIYPAAAPSSSNIITCEYHLFYTGERYRVWHADPEDTGTTKREWQAKIKSFPDISQSVTNIITGTLSVRSGNLRLINVSSDFQAYLTVNDSFYQKDIKVWACLDSETNIQKIFEGKITGISLDTRQINIKFKDNLSALSLPATMGDEGEDLYFNLDDYADLRPEDVGKPFPFVFGSVSRYKTKLESVTNLANARQLDPDSLYSATNTDFSTTVSTTTNRTWYLCRTLSDGFLDFGMTPTNISQADANFTRFDTTAANIVNYLIGDTFVCTNAGTPYYFRVYYVDTTNNYIYATKDANVVTNDIITTTDAPTIVIYDGTNSYYCKAVEDYAVTTESTTGGNKKVKIVFEDNFEANHAGLTALDPTLHQVLYRVKPDTTNMKHGSVVQKLLEASGLTVNSTSITAVNTALAVNANFSIPQFDETDFNNYIRYVQLILRSTLGYILLNNSYEIEYGLWDTPSSTDEVTDTEILKGSYNVSIEYQDIVSQIIAYNPHFSSVEAVNSSSSTDVSNKNRYLHGIDNIVRFRHVLEDITGKIADHAALRSERFAKYRFKTKAENLDNEIGDDLKLNKNGLLGGDSTKQVSILALNKNLDGVTIETSDLYNI